MRNFWVGILVFAAGCGFAKAAETPKQDVLPTDRMGVMKPVSISYRKIAASFGPVETSLDVFGEIAQEPERVFHIVAPQSGTLKGVYFKADDLIEKGDLLASVSGPNGRAAEIRSTSHGILLSTYAKPGDVVDTVTSIMSIGEMDAMRATFNVFEKDLAKIKIGEKVFVESLAYPGKNFEGRVDFIAPQVDEETRAVKVRATIDNREEHLLRLGMFVKGRILIPSDHPVLKIPNEAIQTIDGREIVFLPVDTGEIIVREVRPGRRGARETEIDSGLK